VRVTDSDPDRQSYAATPELAWLILWLICLAFIMAIPAWQVVPLDVIWISLALLYGFRIWPNRRMLAFTGAAVATTGAALGAHSIGHVRVVGDSVVQIPLLAVMVVAMAWQAHRWVAGDDRARMAAKTQRDKRAVAQEDSHAEADELERLRMLNDQLLLIAAILWVCGDFLAIPAMIYVVRRITNEDGDISSAVDRILTRGRARGTQWADRPQRPRGGWQPRAR
jgi:hypothetical protein